jgi:hypothetical protein
MATSAINYLPKVVESGTSGMWTYRKWSDGTAECWADWESASYNPDGQTAGWYRRILSNSNFPLNLFIETPKAFFNLTYWGNGYYWGTIRSITKDAYQLTTYRNDNSASTARGSLYAIGKWR